MAVMENDWNVDVPSLGHSVLKVEAAPIRAPDVQASLATFGSFCAAFGRGPEHLNLQPTD